MRERSQITQLLELSSAGDTRAAAELLPLVYEELRRLAAARMQRIAPGQTLQATALVHEAYLRCVGGDDARYADRHHFFFVAARAMRDILVDQARRRSALKRGGDRQRTSADNLAIAIEAPADDMLALDAALEELRREHPRKHDLVMLRYFAGLTLEQAADALGVSRPTADRDWRFARLFLYGALAGDASDGG